MAVFVLAQYEYWVAQNDTVRLAPPLIFRALGYQTSNRTENYLFFDAAQFRIGEIYHHDSCVNGMVLCCYNVWAKLDQV